MDSFEFLLRTSIFSRALDVQRSVLRDFWHESAQVLEGSGVSLMPFPEEWAAFRRNYFSVLFITVLMTLGVEGPRLRLFARLNHCLRTWVTSCDNLLDDELKELLLTDLPDDARVFKSVHTLLVADRVFFRFVLQALGEGHITQEEASGLMGLSLSAITKSGVEEATEEAGVDYSLTPEEVLDEVHMPKTGTLFSSPLQAPMALGDIEQGPALEHMFRGLEVFGLGCQVLDDLGDLGEDLSMKRNNYLVATVLHGPDEQERRNMRSMMGSTAIERGSSLYRRFPVGTASASARMMGLFHEAVDELAAGGLPFNAGLGKSFISALGVLYDAPEMLAEARRL